MDTLVPIILFFLFSPITLYGIICFIEEFLPQNKAYRKKRAEIRRLGQERYDTLCNSVYFCPQCGNVCDVGTKQASYIINEIDLETERLKFHCECGCEYYTRSSVNSQQWEEIENAIYCLRNGIFKTKEECLEAYEHNSYMADVIMNYYDQFKERANGVWFIEKFVRPLGMMDFENVRVLKRLNMYGLVSDEEYFVKGGVELNMQDRKKYEEERRRRIAHNPRCPKCGSQEHVGLTGYPKENVAASMLYPYYKQKRVFQYTCFHCNITFDVSKKEL